ncbi:hypothetical protein B0H17DRAFT_1082743 [Mycena rosella]|uniref:F-box domain-containing protein n=1 Tax=Mycena rosella TaxID=1033263 RepID=A0AAD7D119_MYCRO|nr:hypothetical protein B0H17DRAFT_1082743 [Mycena rosella]
MVLEPTSNPTPPQEAAEAESTVATMPGSRIQREIAALEKEIAWHYAQIAILKAKRNALPPICSLPNELLCRIFTIYAVDSDSLFGLKWVKQIMYVCHRWHNLAVATQPLWSFIQLGWGRRRIPRFYKQLERSGAAPITLRIEVFEGYYTPAIVENAGRIQAVELRGEAKNIYDFIHSLPHHDFPILSSLNLDPSHKRDELPEGVVEALPEAVFDGRMPRLQELVLRSIAIPWRSLRGLTMLCLTDCGDTASLPHTFAVVLEMLDACPQLRTLELEQAMPPPLLDIHYPTVDLAALAWIRLHDDADTCATLLNHLHFPPTTSVHVFPYGVRAGPDVSDLLIPIRKHLRAPAAPTAHLVHIEGTVSPDRSHYTTSLFCDTSPHDPLHTSTERCPFSINSHPANEGELRRIMTKIFKAIPVDSITHLDARSMTMTAHSWKAALKLLPALRLFGALAQVEQLDREHRTFPFIRRIHIRIISRARFAALRGEPEEEENFATLLIAPLQTYLQAAFDNGYALEGLNFEDRDWCLSKHEHELDQLFPLIGGSMVWNEVVYDPAERHADREAWEVERRELEIKYGIAESN